VDSVDAIAAATTAAETASGLSLLILFGSRARGDARPASDRDFGYIGSTTFDPDRLLAAIVAAVGSDRVDLMDLATAACLHFKLGAPASYADAFQRLCHAGVIGEPLATGLSRAAGFRNVVAHMYDAVDMARVFRAAREGPADLGVSAGAAGPRAHIVGEPFVRKAAGPVAAEDASSR